MADTQLNVRLQLRSDTAANWAAKANTIVLLKGEFAYETDTHKFKIGDGTSNYATLPYISDLADITWNALKPEGGIPASDLAAAVQASLAKADTALQAHQEIAITSGTTNGTISVKIGNAAAVEVAVAGLGNAAYTNSDAYDAAGAAVTVKTEVIGTDDDTATADTIKGAKKYADGLNTAMNTRMDAVEAVIPGTATAQNQLADQNFVNSSIQSMAARFISPTATGGQYDSVDQLTNIGPWYHAGEQLTKEQLNDHDYAVVKIIEDGVTQQYRYGYENGTWSQQYKIGSVFTPAQDAALNSGITAANVAQIETNKADIATVKATADNAMPKAGGDFTGAVTVQTPTADTNPTTKKYVDDEVTTLQTSIINGTVVTGVATKASQDAEGNVINTTYATKTELTNGLAGKQNTIENVTDTAVTGEYVSAVSQTNGKVVITRAPLPTASVQSVIGVESTEEKQQGVIVTTENGVVIVKHNEYTNGTISAKDIQQPYMLTEINVTQGHVTGAIGKTLSNALGELSLILNGGDANNPVPNPTV